MGNDVVTFSSALKKKKEKEKKVKDIMQLSHS